MTRMRQCAVLGKSTNKSLRQSGTFNRDLADKNAAFAEENKSFSVQREKEKYKEGVKEKILGMAKNDPIASSKRTTKRKARAGRKQQKGSVKEEEDLVKKTKEKMMMEEKAQARRRMKRKSSGSQSLCSVVMFGNSTWRRKYKCFSQAEEGAQHVKGAAIKGRDDSYGILKVYKEDGVC